MNDSSSHQTAVGRCSGAALCCFLASAAIASAATLRVGVGRIDPATNQAQVIAGANVCLKDSDGASRGYHATDSLGRATFENLSQGAYTLVVGKSGFVGAQRKIFLGGDRDEGFHLSSGSGGPVCIPSLPPEQTGQEVPPRGSVPQKGMRITHLDVSLNRRIVDGYELRINSAIDPGSLTITQPTHFRIGYRSDLSDAVWQPFTAFFFVHLLPYREGALTAYGQVTVRFQVQAIIPANPLSLTDRKPTIHTSPAVARSFAVSAPAGTVEHVLEDDELKRMLTYAGNRGFAFNTRRVSVTAAHCGSITFSRGSLELSIPAGFLQTQVWEKVTEVSLLELGGREFTPGWKVKSIVVGSSDDLAGSKWHVTRSGERDGDGYRRTIRMTIGPQSSQNNSLAGACLGAVFPLQRITLEGPRDDIVQDYDDPWKNMFPER